MNSEENPIVDIKAVETLLKRVEMTGKARYHAARRLTAHGWFSQWCLSLLAIGQIVISLVDALKIGVNFQPNYVVFINIFFGVLVLAYSLLLGMANFSARAVKMHECGLELGRLARKLNLYKYTGEITCEQYNDCADSYYDILDKYENHTRTDYLVAHVEYHYFEHKKVGIGDLNKISNMVWFAFLKCKRQPAGVL